MKEKAKTLNVSEDELTFQRLRNQKLKLKLAHLLMICEICLTEGNDVCNLELCKLLNGSHDLCDIWSIR